MVLKQSNNFFILMKCYRPGLHIIIWVNANRFNPLSHKYTADDPELYGFIWVDSGLKAKHMHKQVLVVGDLVAHTALYSLLSN